nr:ATP-dependent helicase [uncultured Rhodopila sp.]
MDSWSDIRRKARICHQKALAKAKGDRRAAALLRAALENADLELRHYEPGTTFGVGVLGSFERASGLVNVAKGQDPRDEAVVTAHEIGHNELHHDPISEVTLQPGGLGGDPIVSGAGKVEGYSPRERKEVQADIFAADFLCPADWLRDEYIVGGRKPAEVAKELGVPEGLVMNQLIRALLLPPAREATPAPPAAAYDLDGSQKRAATWKDGPLLVDAGPGTGKTRTLIHRIEHLIGNGSTPGMFLALTFSNKAAEEMRERLSVMNPDAAVEMWVGTFHAFGLELITKWPSAIGRTGKVKVLDEAGSLALLEDNLAKLPLHYYQNLYEPAYELVHVLRAISRCKDELITPLAYRAEAEAAFAAAETAHDADAIEAAEKALELAEIYQIYEDQLAKTDSVDFGDLVVLAGRLVDRNLDVQQYLAKFNHVLVDEYQDVNLASAALLRAICRTQRDVWVVADQRQSIYRFRGAEPTNVSRFVDEFQGARHSLGHNYRSFAPVVRTFGRFSAAMQGGLMAGAWQANRAEGGEVTLTVAPTLAAEAEAVRDKIEHFRACGIPYADQAILARSHLTLARVTGILEQLGVPMLYLGDLFERAEVRDLLSLVGMGAEIGNVGLVRVATLPEYGVPRHDAIAAIRWARTGGIRLQEALTRSSEIDGLSEAGKAGLARLGDQLRGLDNASPWGLLTAWLFERSDYLRPLLLAGDAKAQQQLIAIYHLLKVCGEQAATGDSSRKGFLARIRRIEALNQDTSYRLVASEAADMDAVRVLTIHGSKGLEFGAVHIPALATRYLPSARQGVHCPPPSALRQLSMQPGDHEAEEECLFFVGLSRARDFLSITRAEQYTTQKASPSKFLDAIAGAVRTSRHQGSGATFVRPVQLMPQAQRASYPEPELDVYMRCPGRYRYEAIDGLHGGRDEAPYIQFHRCVYMTVGWLEEQSRAATTADAFAALNRLNDIWKERGPIGHAFESYYRATATAMVRQMAATIAAEPGQYDRGEWLVPVGERKVAVKPDRVVITDRGVRVQRIRTGRRTKSEPDKTIYALLRRGAGAKYPGRSMSVETVYLATGETVLVPPKNDDKRIKDYADAIAAIERGEFRSKPDVRQCPNCPCYFICGA